MDMKVQGKDRLYVKFVAEQLGLDGSYVPRTYIEQIQLEKLVNDVMVWLLLATMHSTASGWVSGSKMLNLQALPDDLKTKLSIDDDFAGSPKEALSRASADRRMKHLGRYFQFFYNLIYFQSKLIDSKKRKSKYMNKYGNWTNEHFSQYHLPIT